VRIDVICRKARERKGHSVKFTDLKQWTFLHDEQPKHAPMLFCRIAATSKGVCGIGFLSQRASQTHCDRRGGDVVRINMETCGTLLCLVDFCGWSCSTLSHDDSRKVMGVLRGD
jgi:hypothetical protein